MQQDESGWDLREAHLSTGHTPHFPPNLMSLSRVSGWIDLTRLIEVNIYCDVLPVTSLPRTYRTSHPHRVDYLPSTPCQPTLH